MKDNGLGIINFPVTNTVALSNLVDVLCFLSSNLYLITGGAGYSFYENSKKVYAYRVEHTVSKRHLFSRAVNYAWTQVRLANRLHRLGNRVDIWFFFVGAEGLILPILTAKLLRKKVIIASAGSALKSAEASNDALASSLALLQNINYNLADKIILYSERMIEERGIEKYRHKILIAHNHFIDFGKFKIYVQPSVRDNVVGYIGRLSEEKGILNFVKAIPDVMKQCESSRYIVAGDGQLMEQIRGSFVKEKIIDKVELLGWLSHQELPKYLNKLKLLVLPSYTEGLPNIMLEAMACGTPVLATSVGAIPDIIKNGETGFIMENNSPECIAQNVIRALKHPNLEQIAYNAHFLVENEFTFEKAIENYRGIINK